MFSPNVLIPLTCKEPSVTFAAVSDSSRPGHHELLYVTDTAVSATGASSDFVRGQRKERLNVKAVDENGENIRNLR